MEPAKSVPNTGLALWIKPRADFADASDSARKVSAAGDSPPKFADSVAGRSAVKFDGKAGCLAVPHSDDLAFKVGDSFTISAWVHLDSVPHDGWKGVVTKSRDAKPWYGLWIEGEGRWCFGGAGNLTGAAAVTGWQHVCAVQESVGGRKLYVKGNLSATGNSAEGSGSGDLWIGGAKSTSEYLEGSIGDVRVYRRALDASEVLYLAQNP